MNEIPRTRDGQLAVSIDEASKRVGVSVATFRRWIAADIVRIVKINRRVLVPVAELERLIDGGGA